MKNLSFLLILSIFVVFSSCKEERIEGCSDPYALNFDPTVQVSDDDGSCVFPPEVKRALLFDITATWCGPCGEWGAPLFDEASEVNAEKLVAISLHASSSGDPMYTPEAEAIADNFPGFTGYPTIVVNNLNEHSSVNSVNSQVNNFVSSGTPEVSAAALLSLEGNVAKIKAQTRYFAEITGELYMAVYILEDDIDYEQNGMSDPDYLHKHVLRKSANGMPFGERIQNGNTQNFDYEVELNSAWNPGKLKLVTVIWKKEGTSYSFVNASAF